MRKLAAVAAVATFVAGIATAQMKVPAKSQPTATSTSPVQIHMNNPGAAQAAVEQSLASAKRIGRDEAIKLVKEGKGVFVDVRSKESYDASHIKGAINLPLSELPTRMGELPRNKEIITYCA